MSDTESPMKKLKMCEESVSDDEPVEFSVKVMVNKEKSKVLFVETGSHFTDILLSFLTLPLGRIVKLLEKHCGDEAPTIGSLNTLYHSLENLSSSHFCTEGAKLVLLNPTSSFEEHYERLKLDLWDYQPAEYFTCTKCGKDKFRSVSIYYEIVSWCPRCKTHDSVIKLVDKKSSKAADTSNGVFTKHTESFIISDDLHILPSVTGLLPIIGILGITDTDKAEPFEVTFGFTEVINLLKASLISQTPLSDVILNRTRKTTHSVIMEPEPEASLRKIDKEKYPTSKKMVLKVMILKSTCKVLYAQAEEDFVQFLLSFMNIPLGGVERLLAGKTCIKTINNLYWSTVDHIDDKYFKTPTMKNRLIKLNLPHGCVSANQTLPLTEECLPGGIYGSDTYTLKYVNFTKGQGNYLKGSRTYQVMDDLTVTPFCFVSILSSFSEMKISICDVKELELQIGIEEILFEIFAIHPQDNMIIFNICFLIEIMLMQALSILKASLTSTSALTDGLLKYITSEQPKPEQH